MLSAALITFREALEVVLVLGIVLAYLSKTHHPRYKRFVYGGLLAALLVSVLFAWLFLAVQGSFEGTSEMVFEGTTMLLAAVLITVTVFWMLRQRHARKEIEQELAQELSRHHAIGIFMIVFISVLRDGVETVIFLSAAVSASFDTVLGALAGIAFALGIGYVIFVLLRHVDIKRLFVITGVLLVLFAAGLFARGIGEYHEAGIVPPIIEHVYDINPGVNADGSYPLTHERGAIGSMMHDLFGYNASPSLVQVVAYLAYLVGVYFFWRVVDKKDAVAL